MSDYRTKLHNVSKITIDGNAMIIHHSHSPEFVHSVDGGYLAERIKWASYEKRLADYEAQAKADEKLFNELNERIKILDGVRAAVADV